MENIVSPKTIEEYIGNKEIVQLFSKWLESIIDNPYNPKRICFLTGLTGNGKSSLVKLVLKKYNFNIHDICSSSLRLKESRKTLYQCFCFKNVLSMINNDKHYRKAIVIDNFENMELSTKKIYKNLKKILKEHKSNGIPIIFIGEKYFKNNRPLLKNSIYLRLGLINSNNNLRITQNIISKLKDHYLNNDFLNNMTKEDIREISKKSKGNIRKIIKNFELNISGNKNVILLEENKQKGPLFSLYRILIDNLSIDNILDEIKTENSALPYALHATLLDYIEWYVKKNNNTHVKEKTALGYKEISKLYATFSFIDDFQKKKKLWELTDIINTIVCWGFRIVLKNEKNECDNKVKKYKNHWWVDFDNNYDNVLNTGIYNKKIRSILNNTSLTNYSSKMIKETKSKYWGISYIKNKIELSKLKKK